MFWRIAGPILIKAFKMEKDYCGRQRSGLLLFIFAENRFRLKISKLHLPSSGGMLRRNLRESFSGRFRHFLDTKRNLRRQVNMSENRMAWVGESFHAKSRHIICRKFEEIAL